MTDKKFRALVKKHGGWIEGGQAYFPSVWNKQQFVKEYELETPNDPTDLKTKREQNQ